MPSQNRRSSAPIDDRCGHSPISAGNGCPPSSRADWSRAQGPCPSRARQRAGTRHGHTHRASGSPRGRGDRGARRRWPVQHEDRRPSLPDRRPVVGADMGVLACAEHEPLHTARPGAARLGRWGFVAGIVVSATAPGGRRRARARAGGAVRTSPPRVHQSGTSRSHDCLGARRIDGPRGVDGSPSMAVLRAGRRGGAAWSADVASLAQGRG